MYKVAKTTGKRHYTKLYTLAQPYDSQLIKDIYNRLEVGIKPTKPELVYACDIARRLLGLAKAPKFYTSDGQHKMELSNGVDSEIVSVIMHLAPSDLSGVMNTCAFATACRELCLNYSGHGPLPNVQAGRIKRTVLLKQHRHLFGLVLFQNLESLETRYIKQNKRVAFRPNGTSDLPWENLFPWMFSMFPEITFYDYTKDPRRMTRKLPVNYSLTFSRSETNHDQAFDILSKGQNVAIVFSSELFKRVVSSGDYAGYRVIDGTTHDRRWTDPRGAQGVIVALKPLGPARNDKSGFVLRPSLRIVGGAS